MRYHPAAIKTYSHSCSTCCCKTWHLDNQGFLKFCCAFGKYQLPVHDLCSDCHVCAEAIDVPWGLPASINATRYRDVAANVGDTVTIHWNRTAGGPFSLWKIPTGACELATLSSNHSAPQQQCVCFKGIPYRVKAALRPCWTFALTVCLCN